MKHQIDVYLNKIDKLKLYEENWNGYGSEAPHISTIELAKFYLLKIYKYTDIQNLVVLPSPDGGTVISVLRGNLEILFEFLNEDDPKLVIVDKDEWISIYDLNEVDDDFIKELVAEKGGTHE